MWQPNRRPATPHCTPKCPDTEGDLPAPCRLWRRLGGSGRACRPVSADVAGSHTGHRCRVRGLPGAQSLLRGGGGARRRLWVPTAPSRGRSSLSLQDGKSEPFLVTDRSQHLGHWLNIGTALPTGRELMGLPPVLPPAAGLSGARSRGATEHSQWALATMTPEATAAQRGLFLPQDSASC